MNQDIERLGSVRLQRHKKRNIWISAVAALSCIVLAISLYSLIKPASASTRDLKPYLTAVYERGDITYDPINDYYIGDSMDIEFKLPKGTLSADSKDYSYTYPNGISMDQSLLDTNYILYDSNNITAGSYKFIKNNNGSYSVLLSFNDKYVANLNGGAVQGSVYFAGIYSKQTVENNDKIHVQFTDNLSIDIPLKQVTTEYDLQVDKSGTVADDKNSITYKVIAYSVNGTPDVIAFQDVLKLSGSDNMSAKFDSITVKKASITQKEGGGYTVTNIGEQVKVKAETSKNSDATKTISLTLPKLEAASKSSDGKTLVCNGYEITYKYTLNVPTDTTLTGRNDVKISSFDKKKGKYVEDSDFYSFRIDKRLDIKKNGWNSNGRGVWSIYVNSNRVNIAGMELKDDMFHGYDIKDFTVSPNNGYEYIYDRNRNITGIRFKAVKNGQNTQAYTINYNTELASDTEPTVNKVTIEGKEATATVYPYHEEEHHDDPEPGDKTTVEKQNDGASISADMNTLTLEWSTKITSSSNGLPKGALIRDNLSIWNECRQYFSYDQLLNIYQMLQNSAPWAGKTDRFRVYANKRDFSEWSRQVNWSDLTEKFCEEYYVYGFSFELTDAIAYSPSGLELHYFSSVDLSTAANRQEFNNTFDVDGASASATYTYQKASFKKTDADGNETDSEVVDDSGKLTWVVEAKLDSLQGYDTATITDYLPTGISLESVDMEVGWMKCSIDSIPQDGNIVEGNIFKYSSDENVHYQFGFDKDSGQAVIKLSRTNDQPMDFNSKIRITYHCKVKTDRIENYKKGNKYSFTNYATIQMGDLVLEGSQTQWWKEEYEVVKKTGTWDSSAQRIHYSIKINEYADDLVAGSDTLQLEDILSYAIDKDDEDRTVSLVQDTVRLYVCKIGSDGTITKNEMTNWNWEYESAEYSADVTGDVDRHVNKITATIPDSTFLILEYDYILAGNFESVEHPTLGVKNTATISGTSYISIDDKEEYEWSKSTHNAVVSGNFQYTFYKVEKANFGNALKNARFTLFEYTDGSNDIDTRKVYKTNEFGTFSIHYQTEDEQQYAFKKDTLYYVMETKAPDGYELPAEPDRYYFFFSDRDKIDLPSGIRAINLLKHGGSEYVVNDIKPISIEVEKIWKDGDGKATQKTDVSEIVLDLHRIDTYYSDNDPNANRDLIIAQNIKIQPDANGYWHYVFDNLNRYCYHEVDGVQKAFPCKYYVEERSVQGYEWVTYGFDGISPETAIVTGKITLVNKAIQYELPETGGMGAAKWPIPLGIVFVLIASIGIGYKVGNKKG